MILRIAMPLCQVEARVWQMSAEIGVALIVSPVRCCYVAVGRNEGGCDLTDVCVFFWKLDSATLFEGP